MADETSEINLQHISLQSGTTFTEQRVSCCKPNYQIRKLRNKGAIVLLVWNFLLINVSHYLIVYVHRPSGASIGTVAVGLTLPFAGWLADVYFGRYRVIHWSMWIMWIGSMLATTSSVVAQLVDGYHKIFQEIQVAIFIIMAIGFGSYQANIIQFGLDQLQDASTTEIITFIRWYVWTCFSSFTINIFTHQCISEEYHILGQTLVCISTTIAISSSFLVKTKLIKEPVTQNPFKLVYKVISYAIKNKHPRCRSAFTYCEDELPSRIDFGKDKYGGPFTTEQVEDVKTFLRLLMIITISSILASELLIMEKPRTQLLMVFLHSKNMKQCYKDTIFSTTIGYCAVAMFIPLYEFVIHPIIRKCIPSIKIYQKFLIGVLLQMANTTILIAFDLIERKIHLEHQRNATIECIFNYDQGALSSTHNSSWIAVSQFLDSTSKILLSISGIEFVASQTPYSMRGLMIGAGYGSVFIFTMIGYGVYWPFTHQSSTWGTGIISCEFWYLLSVLLVIIIFSGLLLAVGRWYKNRKREDVLPNEHIFAERYYSQS